MSMGFEPDLGGRELPLFPEDVLARRAPVEGDPALEVIDSDLRIWDGLCRNAQRSARFARRRREIDDLGRDLRSLRNCYVSTRHPRIRSALLKEAGRITRRMKAIGKTLRVSGLDALPERT